MNPALPMQSPGDEPMSSARREVRYDVSSAYSPPCAQDSDRARALHRRAGSPLTTPLLLLPPAQPSQSFVLTSQSAGTRLVHASLRIGRDPDNDWVLADTHASRQHVNLQPRSDGVHIRDLGSRNGTFINGVRIVEGVLRPGARLTVGQTDFQLGLPSDPSEPDELIGHSHAMQHVRQQVLRFAGSGLPVLILGESGTGKELVARALHRHSARPGPLIAVNCGALPRELIESELFGHERGAFTGAQKRHLGCFGDAQGGTLFLDEIGELPLELQPRLLRVLENRTIRPVGATREHEVDVRIVAATHRNLEQAVHEGRFRADLYYRLCGLEIEVPPLRARSQDIPLLLRHFAKQAERQGHPSVTLPHDIDLGLLQRDPWPGNVRELRAALLRAVHLQGPQLSALDLLPTSRRPTRPGGAPPAEAQPTDSPHPIAAVPFVPPASLVFADVERQALLHALSQAGGNGRVAAELLHMPKSTLYDKLRRLGIHTNRRRDEAADLATRSEPSCARA